MPGAERSVIAGLFLTALEFDHRRQQRPDLAVLQTDQSISARDLGFERDPSLGHAAGFGGCLPLGDFPVARLHARKAMREHIADLIAVLHRLDVPGEGNKVAPVAIRSEHSHGGVEIAGHQRGFEFVEKSLDARVQRGVEHDFLPKVLFSVLLLKVARAYPNYRTNPHLQGWPLRGAICCSAYVRTSCRMLTGRRNRRTMRGAFSPEVPS